MTTIRFRHMLDITLLNCFQIYKRLEGKQKRLNFIINLAEQLVEKYSKNMDQTTSRRSRTPMPSRLVERHFPSLIPPTTKEYSVVFFTLKNARGIMTVSQFFFYLHERELFYNLLEESTFFLFWIGNKRPHLGFLFSFLFVLYRKKNFQALVTKSEWLVAPAFPPQAMSF